MKNMVAETSAESPQVAVPEIRHRVRRHVGLDALSARRSMSSSPIVVDFRIQRAGRGKLRTSRICPEVVIRSILERCRWRVRGAGGAAEQFGLRLTTLETKMAKLGIVRPVW
jgi:hypothetical protein